jgi:hypothetical protein
MNQIALCLVGAALPLTIQAQTNSEAAFFMLTQQARTAFTVEGAGARAMGLAGAFSAVADDGTAVSYNPAGLAQLLRPEASVVVQGFSRTLNFSGFTGGNQTAKTVFEDTSNLDRAISLSFASFAVPWQVGGHNLVFLCSYQKAFDFTFNSNIAYLASADQGATIQAISQRVKQSGGINQYSLAMGAELSHHLLFGLAVNSMQGRMQFDSLSSQSTYGVPTKFDSDLAQSSSIHGSNASLGLIWRSPWLNIGLTYRTPYRANYQYSNTYTYMGAPTVALQQSLEGAATEIKWPETWAGGVALHLTPRLLVTADWSFTPWSHTRIVAPGSALSGVNWFDLQANSVTPKATDQRIGVEWLAVVRPGLVIPLRAGAFREPQPIVDTQTLAQRVLSGWTVGTGVKFKDLTIDLALRASHDYRFVSRRNTDAPIGGVAAKALGNEKMMEYRCYLSCIVQFDTETVHRAILSVVD